MHKKLFIPGPTEVRKEVLDAQAQPMIGHRMKAFTELYTGIISKLKELLETKNFATVMTASGTALMEAAIRNCVNKDVLCCTYGAFSERWFKIAKACDKNADAIALDWGKVVKPEMIEEKLKAKKYEAVTVVHNETSTGVRAPIEQIAEVMKKYPDVLLLVDTVSSLMGDKVEVEKLGIDVCVSSSQKCFALPPGLAIGIVSDRALKKAEGVSGKGHYLNLLDIRDYFDKKGQTPTTPAISLMWALDKQLDKMKAEGMANRYKRHCEMAGYVQNWAKKNFSLYAEPGYESVTVTCINNTKSISVADLNTGLGKRGFAISNGYGKIKELTFRIAHMGDLTLDEVKEVIKNIDEILKL
ncbi:MAG: alanine--glyoxylate aminotransferase family protein [candidate division WOR-3 bacterium]|nr:MAG: alanine--glyoxylate aminotransferase family protein [candidate division WOR-3 bacterium]